MARSAKSENRALVLARARGQREGRNTERARWLALFENPITWSHARKAALIAGHSDLEAGEIAMLLEAAAGSEPVFADEVASAARMCGRIFDNADHG